MILFKENFIPDEENIKALYSANNWLAYTKDMKLTMEGINNSLLVLTAYDNEKLIGLIRIVGDGATIIYIQDILVDPNYQKQGIGKELMERVLSKYSHVRQKVLLTDANEKTKYVRDFYEKLGFVSCDKGVTVAMAKFSN